MRSLLAKPLKPDYFNEIGSIRSSITRANNYFGNDQNPLAIAAAVIYQHEAAHEFWLRYKEIEEGIQITTRPPLQKALMKRFQTLNNNILARDKLERWTKIKGLRAYKEDVQKILLYIPSITTNEKIYHHARDLKSFLKKELCTEEIRSLGELVRDAQRVQMAHRRFECAAIRFVTS